MICNAEPVLPLSLSTLAAFDRPRDFSSWQFLYDFGTNHKGDPFGGASYPYLKGICDAWDNPQVRRVFFRACSRVGKTEINLGLHVASQHSDPDVGLIATPTEALLRKGIKDRLWPMLTLNSKTQPDLPAKHLRAASTHQA
ncbi:phage terminase large subunit family protein [Stieleria tagensis]|uniref:phage terminase large subunit family protein n=1 Tax=Stieleria tagensis TaxID=2956795 RepID=UPI0036F44ECB